MWPFSKPTIEDFQSKAYLVYHEFGAKMRIPREERLEQKFPEIDRTTIKIWLSQFQSIDKEIEDFTGPTVDFDREALKSHLRNKFPFLNRKALDKAAFLAWYWNK